MLATLFSLELAKLGLTPFFQNQVLARSAELGPDHATLLVGRIACERRGEYDVATAERTLRATMSGRLAHELGEDDRPAVGDWVIVEPAHPVGRVKALLERQTVLRRKVVGGSSRAQTLAANVDLCCVVSALVAEDADGHAQRHALNARRIERYLRTAHDSRIEALVVINKADLVDRERGEQLASALRNELPGAQIVLVSAHHPEGLRPLAERLSPGVTAVLLGSSGVGKSSIVNGLLGRETARVGATREQDARGRHTTTARELLPLPAGGILIDTPGMRELALWADADTDVSTTGFADLDALSAGCRFSDCAHQGEPGCAVEAAVEDGVLSAERVMHARKLERELQFQRQRADARVQADAVKQRKVMARAMRAHGKQTGKGGGP